MEDTLSKKVLKVTMFCGHLGFEPSRFFSVITSSAWGLSLFKMTFIITDEADGSEVLVELFWEYNGLRQHPIPLPPPSPNPLHPEKKKNKKKQQLIKNRILNNENAV